MTSKEKKKAYKKAKNWLKSNAVNLTLDKRRGYLHRSFREVGARSFSQNRSCRRKKAQVSVFDHGFLYGDGIYETVHAYEGRVFHWPEHYKRLKQSARLIDLKCPWSSAYLLEGIQKVLRANRAPNASVRITVSRGPGPLGLDPRVCPKPTLAMLLHPDRDVKTLWKNGVSIGIPKVRRNHPLCLDPRIKSNNSLNTILAKMEGTRMGVLKRSF